MALQPARVTIQSAAPATLADLLNFTSDQQLIFWDRHVEKNGGGSMSDAFQKSNCDASYGYAIWNVTFQHVADDLAAGKNSICVDAHSPVPDDWLEHLHATVANANLSVGRPVPRLLTTLRIRSPPSHYHSFYEWDQVPRMKTGWIANKSLLEWTARTPDVCSHSRLRL